ncbi:MAG TPA: hypothetical protein VE912_04550, partial [Bacteroidales bacterium]|nr:hypothetical protein [Bacteroidales bacterium]
YILRDGIDFLGNNGLIIGDFNTGKHYIDEKGKTFYCSEYFDKFNEASLIDSWRSRKHNEKEYSWYSNVGNGFRIDHAFSTPNLDRLITNVHYSYVERENGLSDHLTIFNHFGDLRKVEIKIFLIISCFTSCRFF